MRRITSAMIAWLATLPVFAQPTGPGSALSFDGTGAYVAIATTGSLTGTFTVELWAKPYATVNQSYISSRYLPQEFGFDLQIGAWLPGGGTRIHGDIGNGASWITTSADADYPYQIGAWRHFAFVVTPSVYRIYADGVLVGMGAVSESDALLFDASHHLGIGWNGGFPEASCEGEIDEVRLWSTARSEEEIQINMHRSLTGTESGLMGYWRFDEGSGATVTDASGHGFDGTFVTAPAWVTSTAPIGSLPDGPRLSIQRTSSNHVVIHWPASATGFVLQETSTMEPHAWVDVPELPIEIGGQSLVVISPPTGNRFYRLRQ